jgi:subtilase family serine protease
MLSAISTAVSANEAQVVSMSFGACEQLGFSNSYDSYFKVAVAQGQTFVASTGDGGSSNDKCSGNSVNLPAASRYVVAVGGTTLQTNAVGGYAGETAWSGSGGGYSTLAAIPSAQATVVSGDKRALPDIAFVADPASGVTIRMNGGLVSGVGGTSLSAPLFAGTWARMLSQCGKLGFAAPTLYAVRNLHLSMFNDITSGSNGGYSAGAGWDAVTGLGTPNISNMWAAVCPTNSAYYPLVQHVYLAYLGRPAEPGGLNNMAATLKAANAPTDIVNLEAIYKTNASVSNLLSNMQASSESTVLYPTSNISAYVSALFQTIFNRAPTSAELTKFTSAVSSGTVSIGQLPLNIMNSPSDLYGITTMENRAGVAFNFTSTLTTATAPYYAGQVPATSARHMLQQVTYSNASDNVFDNNLSQPKYIASMQPLINSTIANIVAGIPQ